MTTSLRDVAIIGGGCYGTFYARQLATARERGRLRYRRVIVVDRNADCQAALDEQVRGAVSLVVADWSDFLDEFLAREPDPTPEVDDAIVPSPHMPHLMAAWLTREAARRFPRRAIRTRPVEAAAGTPYDRLAADGTRYVSFADWICPTHCVEPLVCPVIRGPRTWEMADAVTALTRRLGRERPAAGPILFVTRHRAFGVGMFDVAEARAAVATLKAAGAQSPVVDLVVATISACHGAVSVLELSDPVAA